MLGLWQLTAIGIGGIIGWDLLLEYTAIVAVVGIGISGYFGFLVQQLGLNLPEWMLGAPGSDPEQPGRVVDLFALLLCLLIALGVFYVNTDN